MDNKLSLLGLAKKAGFMEIGEESVGAAARGGKARLIISASDASDRSKRQAAGYAANYGVAHVVTDYTKADFGAILGRGSPGMMALTDIGLAFKLVSGLALADPDRYGGLAAGLELGARRAAMRRAEAAAHKRNVMTGKRRKNK